ncbi:ethylmalonyl-CoA decarboxylase isoform X1 [Ahaetulla prasina]|uniref:ethylmalonyl-CoA decarboxylase isoform X1 n=2 Tax=Ahaetulla prasina TaxID=499056 RepID=UPI0026496AA3|nr:ethylmalonyl-CoA decarboxylase isoform X1 [Ahaetulla prasina]
MYSFSDMNILLWKNFHRVPKSRLFQQRMLCLYNNTHGFEEDEIKKKLQQFMGGSVNLSKEDDGIGVLTLNNPRFMNAFTGTMMIELQERITELEDWKDGKGLIIRGAGNTFCSGSDLNAVRALSSSQDGMNMCMFMQNILTRLMRLPLITAALVQGKALGGGAELTTACDFRLMTPESEIRFVHKQMGLVPGWGGAARLTQILGSSPALKLLSGAVKLDPQNALHIGLVDSILSSSDEHESLREMHTWLKLYTTGPAEVIQAVKKVVSAGRELQLEAALRREKEIFGTVWGGPANLQALAQRTKHK